MDNISLQRTDFAVNGRQWLSVCSTILHMVADCMLYAGSVLNGEVFVSCQV